MSASQRPCQAKQGSVQRALMAEMCIQEAPKPEGEGFDGWKGARVDK